MKDCSCETCQNACRTKPGWFAPGEVEKTARNLGLSVKDFFEGSLS